MRNQDQKIDQSFYERHSEAARVRTACIDFARAWEKLSKTKGSDRIASESALEAARDNLIALGVRQGMHVGKDYEYFRTRPLAAAQYCAAQLLGRSASEADFQKLSDAYFKLDNVGSHSIAEGSEAAALTCTDPQHRKIMETAIPRDIVRMVVHLLDANREVWGV